MAMHAGAQQKAAHAQHAVQVLTALLHVPAYPLVSIAKIECCCAEGKATQPAMIGIDEVAQLAAHQGTSAFSGAHESSSRSKCASDPACQP